MMMVGKSNTLDFSEKNKMLLNEYMSYLGFCREWEMIWEAQSTNDTSVCICVSV